jgi:hypothetical protein
MNTFYILNNSNNGLNEHWSLYSIIHVEIGFHKGKLDFIGRDTLNNYIKWWIYLMKMSMMTRIRSSRLIRHLWPACHLNNENSLYICIKLNLFNVNGWLFPSMEYGCERFPDTDSLFKPFSPPPPKRTYRYFLFMHHLCSNNLATSTHQ